jgi:hypothetical protein
MSLTGKKPNRITEADLNNLVGNEPEGKRIDYKREMVGRGDGDRKEFLYDVSSFANTEGGHLVFGMEEDGGLPMLLVGFPCANTDAERLRLEEMLRNGIRPTIPGVQMAFVPLAGGHFALVIYVPKSWASPHQVIYQNAFRFYARHSSGKYQLDVDELRSAFVLGASAAESLKRFRIDRISKIVGGDTPVSLDPSAKMVVHLLPVSAFTTPQAVDVKRLWGSHYSLNAVLRGGGTPLLNIDGVLLAVPGRAAERYAQVFRNGCIEVVAGWSGEANSQHFLPCPAFESAIIEHLYRARELFEFIEIQPPIVVMITMLGIKGWRILTQWDTSPAVFDRDPIIIPEVIIENFDGLVQNDVRPLLDMIWNAAGAVGSPSYDSSGTYTR